MPAAFIDRTDTLSCTEVNGVIRKLIRKMRVVGLLDTNYAVLMDALTQVGVPLPGAGLPGVGFEQLVLAERSPSIYNDDAGTVDVTLTYEHFMDGNNQNLSLAGQTTGVIYGRMQASVQQQTTNFYNGAQFNQWALEGTPFIANGGGSYMVGDILSFSTLNGLNSSVLSVTTASVVNGGSGYAVGDIAFINGGTFASGGNETLNGASVQVIQVGPGGTVQYVQVDVPGTYQSLPQNPVSTQAGIASSGTGLTLSINQTPNDNIAVVLRVTGINPLSTLSLELPGIAAAVAGVAITTAPVSLPAGPITAVEVVESNVLQLPLVNVTNVNVNNYLFPGPVSGQVAVATPGGPPPIGPFTPDSYFPVNLTARGGPGGLFYGGGATFTMTWTQNIQITVKHTFPPNDPNITRRDKTVIQGGEITVQGVQKHFRFRGYVDTLVPWQIADNVIGSINSTGWINQGAYYWLCTEVQWEAMRAGSRYAMDFEFLGNPDLWLPTAVFNDQETNRPPPGLVPGVGYKQIHYYPEINFNQFFQSYFEGWQQVT